MGTARSCPPGAATTLPAPSSELLAALEEAVPGRVRARAIDRLAHAPDASHYLLTPQAVVRPADAAGVGRLLRAAREQGVPLTFRSGGTSLGGQGVTDGVLVDTRRAFTGLEVLDDGARVRVQPGLTVRQVNARLAAHGRRLGPDPASESACTVGGVVANNSSGMSCGTEHNTYATLESLVLVLPSGTVLDTGAPDADERLRALEPGLAQGLERLRERVRGNAESVATLRRLFAMKNTMGYGLNSFLDHTRPVDVLAHLVVGSEGTLAFVAEAVFRTVPLHPFAATGLLVFEDLDAAASALPALVASGPAAVELMDAASLRVAQADPQADAVLRDIRVHRHTALLVEHQAGTPEELEAARAAAAPALGALPLSAPAALTDDARARGRLWHVRKGLYAAVAGARPSGTTALLEDVVVPVPALAATTRRLTGLFAEHGYDGSVVFGHAKDGNLHFLLTERFDDPAALERYTRFSEDLADLVLGRGGSLKAEHGTGRMMTSYVRRQYGDELYAVMREVKRLCDPHGVLSPGVVLEDDEGAHLRHLKAPATVEPEVDRCVECGYCEPVCPSRHLTTTPRQRIVLRRAIARARDAGDEELVREVEADYAYDGVDTCAVDGMCQTACPVSIDTGALVRRLRAQDRGPVEQALWRTAAGRWGAVTRAAAAGLDAAAALPSPVVEGATEAARRVLGAEAVPRWTPDLPRGGRSRADGALDDEGEHAAAQAVLFSSCTGAMFAPADGGPGATAALRALCERAGVGVVVPEGLPDLCCGTPWKSKGMTGGHAAVRARVVPALQRATRGGELPVVVDASSCTEGLDQLLEGTGVRVLDAVPFVLETVLPRLAVTRRLPSVVLHPTCSSARLGTDPALRALAAEIADEVVVPLDAGCCAFAGDRGMLHPELTASATAPEAREVAARAPRDGATAHASSNRTCEIGMARATGRTYRHLAELVEEATRPLG